VGKWYQGKTYEALSFDRNYKSYFPIAVTKINKQIEESILLEHIDVDDELMIRSRELIPADSILLEGTGRIDYSFVTGESTPVTKNKGDFIYAGGRQVGEIIVIKVEKKVSQSHLTKLWNQDRTYEKPGDSLKSLSDRISRYFTIIIIAIAVAGFTYWMIKGDTETAMFAFTAVLIVACPCALALSIPFTFGSTMRIFGRKGLYIKNTGVIERLSHVDTIVFDKTGTLTRPNESSVEFLGDPLTAEEATTIHSLSKQSTHPLSNAIAGHYPNAKFHPPDHFVEVPGRGIFGKVNGMEVMMGSQEYVTNSPGIKNSGSSVVFLSINGHTRGHYIIGNRYRNGYEEVLERLGKEFNLYLVSGDNNAEEENLIRYFKRDHLLFNQKPADKAEFIRLLQENGNTVLMTGDGLNDAAALMQSDVALNIVKLSFIISFLYNLVGIIFAISGNLSPIVAAILMPVSSVSVVAFATFTSRASACSVLR
jgi:Cu+-exporting ATPase